MQARSLQKRHDLLKAGRKLLHTRVLEEISIKDICTEAGCTVGSFYSRFEDKESYFDALIAESCQELLMSAASQFDDRNWVGVEGKLICDEVVSFLVGIFQGEYSSILTEAFIRESKGFIESTPMRDVGFGFITTVSKPLLHTSTAPFTQTRCGPWLLPFRWFTVPCTMPACAMRAPSNFAPKNLKHEFRMW